MQWCTQDLAKGEGNKTGGRGRSPQPPEAKRSGGVAPAANEFSRFSHKKTPFLTHYFMEKGHAVSAVTTSVARIWQWEGEFENDITFDYKLYTGADPESFGGVHATLN